MELASLNASDRSAAARRGANEAAAIDRLARARTSPVRDVLYGSIALVPVAVLVFLLVIGHTPGTTATNLMVVEPIKNLMAALPPTDARRLLFWLEINRIALHGMNGPQNAVERTACRVQGGSYANYESRHAAAVEAHIAKSRLRQAVELVVGAVSTQMSATGRFVALRWLRQQEGTGARASAPWSLNPCAAPSCHRGGGRSALLPRVD